MAIARKTIFAVFAIVTLFAAAGPSAFHAHAEESGAQSFPDYNTSPAAPDASGMEKDAVQIASEIALGWNMGNTLEAIGGETAWGNPKITPALIKLIKDSGFDAIRLPVSWHQYANAKTAKIKRQWLERIHDVVTACIEEDLYVVLNIHWDTGWLENNVTPEAAFAVAVRQRAYWQQIATHLRDFDQRLLFASANEPHVETPIQMAVLDAYHLAFVNAVRETGGRNAYRVLVVQGPKTDIETTDKLWTGLPKDTVPGRMMAEVHFYTPYNFTLMQKDEDWGKQFYYWGKEYHSKSDRSRNANWGEEDSVDKLFAMMKRRFVDQGIPVILGEYSAQRRSTLKGDALKLHLASRAHYHEYVTRKALENGLLPFYWDAGGLDNHSSGIFDRRRRQVFDTMTLEALLAGAGKSPQ